MKVLLRDLSFCKLRGVYFIVNTITGRIYVGSCPTTCFKSRFKRHLNSLLKRNHENTFLQKDVDKYGISNFLFVIKEVVEGTDEDVICREQFYLDTIEPLYNKHKKAFYPNHKIKQFGSNAKRNATINEGLEFYKKYKQGNIKLSEIPDRYKGFVMGKSSFKVWNKGKDTSVIDYSFLKGIPKRKTELWEKGRMDFKNTMRNKSSKIYVFDYNGVFLKTFRSVSDIVDFSKSGSNNLPIITQSNKPRKSKNGVIPIEHFELNNVLRVCKGKKRSYKGLIFSYQESVNYKLKPSDIKYSYTKWSQCHFTNHSCPTEESVSEKSGELLENLGEDNQQPSQT